MSLPIQASRLRPVNAQFDSIANQRNHWLPTNIAVYLQTSYRPEPQLILAAWQPNAYVHKGACDHCSTRSMKIIARSNSIRNFVLSWINRCAGLYLTNQEQLKSHDFKNGMIR